ncbi:MAG: ABC transporter ATP-binding protein [Bacillota bacterium]|nr:MAG: ABC transporter ATP-binding protein [Bacillota bacterium]
MLKLENVTAHYGTIQALKGVSISVNEGEIVTVIGANGAGKTTLLKTISGLVSASSGKVYFYDKDITNLPTYDIVASGIVLVPEGRRVFPRMTVRENLQLGGYLNKNKEETRANMERVFELFPILKDRLNQIAGTLSGGEQQMLAIGRALMSRPRLLLLDEPSMGLAPKVVLTIFDIIRQINREGTTILLVEQNAHLALSTAHKAYVLETGRIVMEDTAEKLLHNEQVRKAYLGEM